MTSDHRVKIQNSNILNALIEHVDGRRDMSASQVTAGIALLKKVLPDLASVEHSGGIEMLDPNKLPDAALAAIIAADQGDEDGPSDPLQVN
jgi:hypothetical protein